MNIIKKQSIKIAMVMSAMLSTNAYAHIGSISHFHIAEVVSVTVLCIAGVWVYHKFR